MRRREALRWLDHVSDKGVQGVGHIRRERALRMPSAHASLLDVKREVKDWQLHYNTDRPHSALGNLAPREFAANTGQGRWAG